MENLERIENYCSLVIRLDKGEFDVVETASDAATFNAPSAVMGNSDPISSGSVSFSNLQDTNDSDAELSDADASDSKPSHVSLSPSPSPGPPATRESPDFNEAGMMKRFGALDQDGESLIRRRRQAINHTATGIALKSNGGRRRLSSIMVPTVPNSSSSGKLTSLGESGQAASEQKESAELRSSSVVPFAAAPSSPPSRPAPMLKKNSLVKIWDIVEDDSDDESDTDGYLRDVVNKMHSKELPEDDAKGEPPSAVDSPLDQMLDDDAEDAIIAIDIERAINERQRETEVFDRSISLSSFVYRDRRDNPLPPPVAANPKSPGSRHRSPSIAQRLVSFMSSPKSSAVSVHHSTEDPSVVFGDDDLEIMNDMELGLAGSLFQRDHSASTGMPAPQQKGGNSASPAYLRDCLAIRESSILEPGVLPATDLQAAAAGSIVRGFEGRIIRLLNHLSNLVRASNGAGGKPYQILTTAGELHKCGLFSD
jgi:hypothetical protein